MGCRIYIRPGKSTSKGTEGIDYFTSEDGVLDYCAKNNIFPPASEEIASTLPDLSDSEDEKEEGGRTKAISELAKEYEDHDDDDYMPEALDEDEYEIEEEEHDKKPPAKRTSPRKISGSSSKRLRREEVDQDEEEDDEEEEADLDEKPQATSRASKPDTWVFRALWSHLRALGWRYNKGGGLRNG